MAVVIFIDYSRLHVGCKQISAILAQRYNYFSILDKCLGAIVLWVTESALEMGGNRCTN